MQRIVNFSLKLSILRNWKKDAWVKNYLKIGHSIKKEWEFKRNIWNVNKI